MKHSLHTLYYSLVLLILSFIAVACSQIPQSLNADVSIKEQSEVHIDAREIIDFNRDWLFRLGDTRAAFLADKLALSEASSSTWTEVTLPHDWSVDLPYSQENTASSTGFKAGGVGWYRKTFSVSKSDLSRTLWLEFDGIYNNSSIWINGTFAYQRPNGYSSFKLDLNKFLQLGENVISIKVDRRAYNDSRWYTGSGIYRNVRLIKTSPQHISHWGVQVLTPEVSVERAKVNITTQLNLLAHKTEKLSLKTVIRSANGEQVAQQTQAVLDNTVATEFELIEPKLWDLQSPDLYQVELHLLSSVQDKKPVVLDTLTQTFGIRSIKFDANEGFFLNGVSTKIKGVNLHHDAGALGAAVPKAAWRYRLKKLQSIGVNAIRLSHNPHSPELLELADEMGFLVMAESFDDWLQAKKKSVVYLSDNAGKGKSVESYTEHFAEWAERDLRDLIKRDFNHPSIIMWSIGNEVEWTYPYYAKSQVYEQESDDYYGRKPPIYDPAIVKQSYDENKGDQVDNLVRTAHFLSRIVKSMDTSRPVTAGLVTPSVDFVSGYADALDVAGFNYRAQEYDSAHKVYPDKPLVGSENWGTWPEWKAALDRKFIPGIFVWTGFAYKGEAGPWPRKGLEISFFDFAGNKTPRGHQFETFWVDKPKVYLATIPAVDSEYKPDSNNNWSFTERKHPIKQMQWLRKWEWYGVKDVWNYNKDEEIVVHVYANTDESELFLNGQSLGRQTITDDNNRILFWQVPFAKGELKVVGYNNNKKVAEYSLHSHQSVNRLALYPDKLTLSADAYDLAHIHAHVLDKNGNIVTTNEQEISFTVEGPAQILALDNGWENNVQIASKTSITSYLGKALGIVQSTKQAGEIKITAHAKGLDPVSVVLQSKPASEQAAFTSIFDGKNLDNWIVKTHKYEHGDDPDATFSVHEGSVRVDYTRYQGMFDDRYSHLFYDKEFENFHLSLEYRFRGDFYPGAPYFAELNSGVMFYSQSPQSIPKNQNWPLSVEMQFLAGLKPDESRPTGNMCSPGTDVSIDGQTVKPHCVSSSSPTFYGDQWVLAELVVNNGYVSQYINGDLVLEYSDPRVGFTGTIKGIKKEQWQNGSALNKGFIALQSEGQPIDFRNIKIKEL